MDVDEGDDAAIRVAAGHDGKDGEQQDVGQLIELALPTPGIGDVRQQTQQRRKCSHGNLRLGCRPRSQTSSRFGNPLSEQPLHFTPPVLQPGLTHPYPSALNSPGVLGRNLRIPGHVARDSGKLSPGIPG